MVGRTFVGVPVHRQLHEGFPKRVEVNVRLLVGDALEDVLDAAQRKRGRHQLRALRREEQELLECCKSPRRVREASGLQVTTVCSSGSSVA